MRAGSTLKRPHRSSCPHDRFPNTWRTCSASKQEQSRSLCRRNDSTIHKPTEDKTWLQHWIGDSRHVPVVSQRASKDWAPVATLVSLMHTLRACLLSSFSPVQLCATLWSAACQAHLSTGFSRQEYWSGIPCPPPGDPPDPVIKLASLTSSALAGRFFPIRPIRKPYAHFTTFHCIRLTLPHSLTLARTTSQTDSLYPHLPGSDVTAAPTNTVLI